MRTSITAYTNNKDMFSTPFGIFYVRTEIWKEIFQKKVAYNSLMACSLLSNYHFKMGVTVMGLVKHFGQCHFPSLWRWIFHFYDCIYIGFQQKKKLEFFYDWWVFITFEPQEIFSLNVLSLFLILSKNLYDFLVP